MRELEHLLKRAVRHPNVVVPVDSQSVWFEESVLPPRRQQLSARSLEHHDRRRRNWVRLVLRPGLLPPVKYENVVVRVHADSGNLSEHIAFRQNRPTVYNRIWVGPWILLGGGAHREQRRYAANRRCFFFRWAEHDRAPGLAVAEMTNLP